MNARLDTHRVMVLPKLTEADLDAHEADRLPVVMPHRPGLIERLGPHAAEWTAVASMFALGVLAACGWLPGAGS